MPRFYDPDVGRVLFGGHDVRTLDLPFLHLQVAVVNQEVFLFHGSVRDNILFGRPDAGDAELRAAESRYRTLVEAQVGAAMPPPGRREPVAG